MNSETLQPTPKYAMWDVVMAPADATNRSKDAPRFVGVIVGLSLKLRYPYAPEEPVVQEFEYSVQCQCCQVIKACREEGLIPVSSTRNWRANSLGD